MNRSTTDVFEDHLKLRVEGDLETDLQRNYSETVILLTENSNAQGYGAMRMSARRLAEQLPNGSFEFLSKQVNGPFALLIWRAESDLFNVIGGAARDRPDIRRERHRGNGGCSRARRKLDRLDRPSRRLLRYDRRRAPEV